ncbi:hypothetical protein FRC0201_01985 [Corynebacterium diphtheriae]|nr:hypothetical protein FRC0026_01972 [Corynebacterium diphtheriae]CAB0814514.1 hypothetical protein FRC0201_01985 [Corynebacterium diphtheriae]CAB1007380.1 hypothetical protein FRC0507_01947 [Corynebacterium diphtheriae]
MAWLGLTGVGGRWCAPPPFTPEKTALHTKSSQTAGLEAIWCEVRRKMLRNTPVWWLFRFESALISSPGVRAWLYAERNVFTIMAWLGLAGVGSQVTPVHPRKDGTSHQIQPIGRFGSDLV